MQINQKTILIESIPQAKNEDSGDSNRSSNIKYFIENIKTKTGKEGEELLSLIIRGLIENVFKVEYHHERNKTQLNIALSVEADDILLESDFFFRLIHLINPIVGLVDEIYSVANRFKGMAVVYELYSERSFFKSLKIMGADVYEITFLLKLLRCQLLGLTEADLMTYCEFFPLSKTTEFMFNLTQNNSFMVEEKLITVDVINSNYIKINAENKLLGLTIS
jgi:hypothetical protein